MLASILIYDGSKLVDVYPDIFDITADGLSISFGLTVILFKKIAIELLKFYYLLPQLLNS